MKIVERSPLTPALRERVTAFVSGQKTLEDVTRRGVALRPPAIVTRVVIQDEYTHDVVLPFADHFLVYDAT